MADVEWRLHLAASPEAVYDALATASGRAAFWAESAEETDGVVTFMFPNDVTWSGRVVQADRPSTYAVEYFGGSVARFILEPDGAGGTDLALRDEGVADADLDETRAGWVSVLLNLKACVDHGVDLRNHDRTRTWDQGFAEN
jgi:uncharacterized protein YndB with AHSA1/START domain